MTYSIKKQIDSYIDFDEWYFRIINELNFDYQKDLDSRDFLSKILKEKSKEWNLEGVLLSFNQMIKRYKRIFIYGCGPSLEESVKYLLRIQENRIFTNTANLVADGSARLLIEQGIHINAIFTDLDGIVPADFDNSEFVIVHAHGDNISKLKYFKNKIIDFPNVIGTTQVNPVENLVNSGGFTDGDRILFFIASLLNPIHKIFFIGMDFNEIVGKYSKIEMETNQLANPLKLKKLSYGLKVINWLLPQVKNSVYSVNSRIESVNLKSLTLEMFKNRIISKDF